MRWGRMVLQACPLSMSLEEYLDQNERKTYLSIVAEEGDKIVEVGFGSGLGLIYLASLGKDVTGVDSDNHVISVAKKRMKRSGVQIPLIKSDAFDLPFAPGSFDVAFHEGLLEHFDHPNRLKMLEEHLRVAEKVVVDVPTLKAFYGKAPFNERLQSVFDWILEWHRDFKLKFVFERSFVAVGGVLTR